MLGENEPHPMAPLAAGMQLRQRLLINAVRLGVDKALQVVWVAGHLRQLTQFNAYFALVLAAPEALLATRGLPTLRPWIQLMPWPSVMTGVKPTFCDAVFR